MRCVQLSEPFFGDGQELPDEGRGVLDSLSIEAVDGVVADLGVSSAQLDQGERGFSLAKGGPIDMRMDPTEGETALEIIAQSDAESLANLIYRYGEEHRSRRIARSLKQAYEEGGLQTTGDLKRAVHRATPGELHPELAGALER